MRLTDEQIAKKEKQLGRRLSSTEKGIYGRQATPEEQIRLSKFAREWSDRTAEQTRRDVELLRAFVTKYLAKGNK